ncbi:uncharacterized protein LOC131877613, partial [Tigriopus californicus]|uniref:uncharacterized protein LOC131877613 n=1 Tax=Tigriopus californicus TaxID=6832 RepID=UPI0027DA1B3E
QTVVLVVYISLGNVIGAIQTKDPVSNEDSTHALKDASENRLYFQGPDYTVNLIPLAILIKIIFVIGYVIKYLLDESNEVDTYGSTGTGYGGSQSGNSYESPAQGYNSPSYEPPASSYDAHSSSNSFASSGSSYQAPASNSYSAPSSGYSSPHGSRVDGVKSVMTTALEKLADLGVSGVVKLSTMLSGEDSNGVKEDIKIHDAYGNDITDQVVYLNDQRQGKLEDGPFAKILNSGFQSVRRSYLDTEQVRQRLRKRTRKDEPRPVKNDPSEFQGSPAESGTANPTPFMNMLPSQRLTPQDNQDPYVQDYYYTEGIWGTNPKQHSN